MRLSSACTSDPNSGCWQVFPSVSPLLVCTGANGDTLVTAINADTTLPNVASFSFADEQTLVNCGVSFFVDTGLFFSCLSKAYSLSKIRATGVKLVCSDLGQEKSAEDFSQVLDFACHLWLLDLGSNQGPTELTAYVVVNLSNKNI